MTATQTERRVKVLGIGPDGRKIYTADADARAGHRSATNSRPAGTFVGRDLHLGVAVPALMHTDTTSWVRFGRNVPTVIVTADLVPAGTHPGDAVRNSLLAAAADNLCHDVVFDPGYSLKKPVTLLTPLAQAGIDVTLRPASHQVGVTRTIGDAWVIDGQLFSPHVPDTLAELRLPNRNADKAERDRITRKFNQRAAFRYGRLKAPGKDGTTRWKNPMHAGRVRSRDVPRSMRGPETAPIVTLRKGYGPGATTVTVGAEQLPLAQPTIVGTTAWHEAYGRRNLVESTNSSLHGEYIDIDKGYVRTLRTGRLDTLIAHGLAGWNRWVIDQWNAFIALFEDPTFRPTRPRAPRRNRLPRYEDLTPRGTSPPG